MWQNSEWKPDFALSCLNNKVILSLCDAFGQPMWIYTYVSNELNFHELGASNKSGWINDKGLNYWKTARAARRFAYLVTVVVHTNN